MNLKKSILLINVLLTILIVWMLGSIAFTWASNLGSKSNIKESATQTNQTPVTVAVLTRDLKDFEPIIKKDIFKTPDDTSGAASVNKGKNAQETALNLILRGTAVGDNNASYAIIFDRSTGKEDLYEINATVQGARIQEILADRVILNVNGREETLILPVENNSGGNPRPAYRQPEPYRPPRKVSRPPKIPKKKVK